MIQQTIQFTIMPRGLTLNPATLPVSVLVSPRLSGADNLGSFPDWLSWTQRVKDQGLQLVLRCGVKTMTVTVDTTPLQPDLWGAMFNEETYVRSYAYPDYTQRAVFSYPVRLALSALKSMYQQGGVLLALPERGDSFPSDQRESGKTRILKGLVAGFEVNWDNKTGEQLRASYRAAFAQLTSGSDVLTPKYNLNWLNDDGTFKAVPPGGTPAAKGFNQFIAGQFAIYSHMPQGKPISENPPDFDNLIDFHQALSSLNSYPGAAARLGVGLRLRPARGFRRRHPDQCPRAHGGGGCAQPWLAGRHQRAAQHARPGDGLSLFSGQATPNSSAPRPGLLGGGLTELDVFGLLNLDPTRYRAGPGRRRERHAQNPAPGRNLPGQPPRPQRAGTPRSVR